VEAGAVELDALVTRLRGAGEERMDLVGISTGGQVVRFFAGHAGAAVRRAVYVGAPQRGTFDALASMHRGWRFAPGGKLFSPAEAALCQTCFDALPHPDDRVFTDTAGRTLDVALHDAETWARLGLHADARAAGFRARLERARDLHRTLDRLPHAVDAVIIGGRHLPTPARAVVIEGRARLPPLAPRRDDPFVGYTYVPGDGELSDASLCALPGVGPERVWYATPSSHGRLPADPKVHALVLEALLATDRKIHETRLGRSLRVVPP
jgi:pimeloyl-ACP methyl ester carboxylesterase